MSFLNKETASTTAELFKDALINNTFNERCISDSLKMEIENSYSYLYRLQRNMIRYERFHFQTKTRDLRMSKSQKDDLLKELDELLGSSLSEEEKESVLQQRQELIRVDYGDYYLDDRYRASMMIDFDLINNPNRQDYKMSKYDGQEISMDDIITHPDIFASLPIIMVDNLVYYDCKFKLNHGTTIIIFPFGESFIYEKDFKQKFHDTCIMTVDNIWAVKTHVTKNNFGFYSTLKNQLPVRFPYYDRPIGSSDGIFFSFIKYGDKVAYEPFVETKYIPTTMYGSPYFEYDFPDSLKEDMNQYQEYDIYTVLFPHLKKHCFYTGSYEISPYDLMVVERGENTPYAMPIPENSFLVMALDGDRQYPMYGATVELHYPNIYNIKYDHIARDSSEKFIVYYFYEEAQSLKYTRMHDFYYRFLSYLGENMSLEELMNHMYHNEFDQITHYDWIQDSDRFKVLQKFIFDYRVDQQLYSINDFITRETWTEYPISYQVKKMKSFIHNDFNVLRNYARHNHMHETMFHLYANSINIPTRFRSSTSLENCNSTPFFSAFYICDEDNIPENALKVISYDEEFIPFQTIYENDFNAFAEKPKVGQFVTLDDYQPQYVFMMRPRVQDTPRQFRIFIDGLYEGDYLTFVHNDSQYIYLPINKINENSYILLEELFECKQVIKHTFKQDEKFKLNIIGNEYAVPTAQDVFILDQDGYEVPYDMYKITPYLKGSAYTMHLEDGTEARTHASVLTMEIEMVGQGFLNQECSIYIGKKFERYHKLLDRISFPRITLHGVYCNRQLSHLQIWKNGRLLPENLYKQENIRQFGIYRIQILTQFNKGDILDFDFSPYTHELKGVIDGLGPGGVLDLKNYINKPVSIDYYDFYINGRRLGLPNVYQVGRTGVTFTNLKSTYHLEIYERERDEEYFGFEDGDEKYFYDELDFIDEPFLRKEDREHIIKEIIDNQKDPRTTIEPNENFEEHIVIDNLPHLEESAKIFYYEEFLPLGIMYPDVVQFDKAYFKYEYPELASMYLVNQEQTPDLENGDVIMVQPDFNIEKEMANMIVMLYGENEIND